MARRSVAGYAMYQSYTRVVVATFKRMHESVTVGQVR